MNLLFITMDGARKDRIVKANKKTTNVTART